MCVRGQARAGIFNVLAAELTEVEDLLERIVGISREMQHGVQQGTRMSIRENEAITIELHAIIMSARTLDCSRFVVVVVSSCAWGEDGTQ